MECFWCPGEANDPKLYFEVLGRRFALCTTCANITRDLLLLVGQIAQATKRDKGTVTPLRSRKVA